MVIGTSNTFEFLKRLFLFVRIKSMQVEFGDWKQVGLFIKLSRLNVFINTSRFLLFLTVKLKSSIDITFSYWHVCLLKTIDKIPRKQFSSWDGDLWRSIQGHFWVLTKNSNIIISISLGIVSSFMSLHGMFSMKNNHPPPCLFLLSNKKFYNYLY